MQLSSVISISLKFIPEKMATAFRPFFFKLSTWSFINAIRGETTIQIPSCAKVGTWKQMDFPPPVGIIANASFPFKTELIISSCKGLN